MGDFNGTVADNDDVLQQLLSDDDDVAFWVRISRSPFLMVSILHTHIPPHTHHYTPFCHTCNVIPANCYNRPDSPFISAYYSQQSTILRISWTNSFGCFTNNVCVSFLWWFKFCMFLKNQRMNWRYSYPKWSSYLEHMNIGVPNRLYSIPGRILSYLI